MGRLKPKNCIECGKEFMGGPTAKCCCRKCQKLAFAKAHGIEKICEQCGKSFMVHPMQDVSAKFCSRECYWKDKGRNKVEITCEVCGKKRLVSQCYANLKRCSRKCMGIARKGFHHTEEAKQKMSQAATERYGYSEADRVKPCAICGKPVRRDYPSHLKAKPTCSDECYREFMRTDPDVKSGQSVGGKKIGAIRKRDGLSEAHKEAIRAAKAKSGKRAEYECENCGKKTLQYKSEAEKYEHHFCSKSCSTAWKVVHTPRGKESPSYGVPPPPGAGRCKWIDYESPTAGAVKLQGTLELRFAKLLDAAGLEWRRPKERFAYRRLDGVDSTYAPDFKVRDGDGWLYVDTKGYLDAKCAHKLDAVSRMIPLKVVRTEDVDGIETGKSVRQHLFGAA